MTDDVTQQKLELLLEEMFSSRYENADAIREWAQSVLDQERDIRIAQLREMSNRGREADKQLVELGAVGAPRKTAKKRSPRKKTEAVAG